MIRFSDPKKAFDYELGKYLKALGMSLAAEHKPTELQLARSVAHTIADQGDGTCHADQVNRVLLKYYGIESIGNAAGSIFKCGAWEFTGERVQSHRVSSHANELKVWRLV